MTFKDRANDTAREVFRILGLEPTNDQAAAVAVRIERALVKSAVESTQHCTKVALDCCPEDRDIAHKIAVGLRQAEQALITNLSALR